MIAVTVPGVAGPEVNVYVQSQNRVSNLYPFTIAAS
jgi:hypothetical protein